MKIDVISFTESGNKINIKIAGLLSENNVTSWGKGIGLLPYSSLSDYTRGRFCDSDALIFIGAAGIAVRAIAPFIKAKDRDPAVIVIDDKGRFVIPILSGHIGGANALAGILAQRLMARAVITTATDLSGVFAADVWAIGNECKIPHSSQIKHISAALLNGEKVGILSDFPIEGELPDGLVRDLNTECGIVISINRDQSIFSHSLHIVPSCVHLGVGCRKGLSAQVVTQFVMETLADADISPAAVKAVSSFELKRDEPALLSLSETLGSVFRVYSLEELESVNGKFHGSEFVKSVTGIDNICERAAAKSSEGGRRIIEKTAGNGVTVAACIEDWRAIF